MTDRNETTKAEGEVFSPDRVLIATDFSDGSRAALEEGVLLAGEFGAVAELVAVVPNYGSASRARSRSTRFSRRRRWQRST